MGTLPVQRTASSATQDGCRDEIGAMLRAWREIRGVRTYALSCPPTGGWAVCVNTTTVRVSLYGF